MPPVTSDPTPEADPPQAVAVSRLALYFIVSLEEYYHFRAQLLRQGLFGRDLGLSEARMAVIRHCVIDYSGGRCLPVAECVARLRAYASENKLRDEIRLLREHGIIEVVQQGRRALIRPSRKLVDYLNANMPKLRDFVAKVIADAPDR